MNNPYLTPLSSHAPPSSSSSISSHLQEVPSQRLLQQPQRHEHNTTYQSHLNVHPNLPYNATPSAEQRAAVITLQAFPDLAIFNYLRNFRSFLCGQQKFYPNQLSPQQCYALSALTECSDEVILAWLHVARSHRTLVSSQNFSDSSVLCNGRVAANPFVYSPSFASNTSIRNTPRGPFDQGSNNLSRGDSVTLPGYSGTSSNEHDRWCFICEEPNKPFTTLDGFKRHVREHYTRYYCIPQDALVYMEDGPRCAFCSISNPDIIHLNAHNVSECVGTKFSRKKTLIKHLEKKHSVHDNSMLADQSEYSVDKKYFACGFCIFCCGSLNEQTNHIDAAHYRFSQHIRDWDQNKVIRGLLSQPVVNECWRGVLAANPHLQESLFRWNPTIVKQLKHRLEMSREPAVILCNAAIDASNCNRNWHGHLESVPVSGTNGLTDQEMATDQSSHNFQSQGALSPLSYNSEQSYVDHSSRMAASALQSQRLAMDWAKPISMDRDENRPCSQIVTATNAPRGSAIYNHTDHSALPLYLQTSDERSFHNQHSAYLFPTASTSGTPQAMEGHDWTLHDLRHGGHPLGFSLNFIISLRLRCLVETYTDAAQAHASWNSPTSAIQSTMSPLSREHDVSPLGHLDDTCNRRHHPALTAQSSHQETTHFHGMDLSSDSDDPPQSFRQARGRSRRQRRNF